MRYVGGETPEVGDVVRSAYGGRPVTVLSVWWKRVAIKECPGWHPIGIFILLRRAGVKQ